MKKLLSIVLLAVLTLSFIACEQTQKADKYCVKCGTGLVKNAMYCSNCGNPANNNVSNLPDETQNTTVKLTPRPRPQQFFLRNYERPKKQLLRKLFCNGKCF